MKLLTAIGTRVERRSPLAQGRGLKHAPTGVGEYDRLSPLAQGCGLKPNRQTVMVESDATPAKAGVHLIS